MSLTPHVYHLHEDVRFAIALADTNPDQKDGLLARLAVCECAFRDLNTRERHLRVQEAYVFHLFCPIQTKMSLLGSLAPEQKRGVVQQLQFVNQLIDAEYGPPVRGFIEQVRAALAELGRTSPPHTKESAKRKLRDLGERVEAAESLAALVLLAHTALLEGVSLLGAQVGTRGEQEEIARLHTALLDRIEKRVEERVEHFNIVKEHLPLGDRIEFLQSAIEEMQTARCELDSKVSQFPQLKQFASGLVGCTRALREEHASLLLERAQEQERQKIELTRAFEEVLVSKEPLALEEDIERAALKLQERRGGVIAQWDGLLRNIQALVDEGKTEAVPGAVAALRNALAPADRQENAFIQVHLRQEREACARRLEDLINADLSS